MQLSSVVDECTDRRFDYLWKLPIEMLEAFSSFPAVSSGALGNALAPEKEPIPRYRAQPVPHRRLHGIIGRGLDPECDLAPAGGSAAFQRTADLYGTDLGQGPVAAAERARSQTRREP